MFYFILPNKCLNYQVTKVNKQRLKLEIKSSRKINAKLAVK